MCLVFWLEMAPRTSCLILTITTIHNACILVWLFVEIVSEKKHFSGIRIKMLALKRHQNVSSRSKLLMTCRDVKSRLKLAFTEDLQNSCFLDFLMTRNEHIMMVTAPTWVAVGPQVNSMTTNHVCLKSSNR